MEKNKSQLFFLVFGNHCYSGFFLFFLLVSNTYIQWVMNVWPYPSLILIREGSAIWATPHWPLVIFFWMHDLILHLLSLSLIVSYTCTQWVLNARSHSPRIVMGEGIAIWARAYWPMVMVYWRRWMNRQLQLSGT